MNEINKSTNSVGVFPHSRRLALSCFLVMAWWVVVAVQSISNLGPIATVAYLLLPIVAVMLHPSNAFAFLTAAFFLPVGAIEVPRAYLVLFVTVFVARVLCAHPRLRNVHNALAALFLSWLFTCIIMSIVAPDEGRAMGIMMIHFESVLFGLVMLLCLDSIDDAILAIKWMCFFAGLAFLLCLCHWLWFETTWMTSKLSSFSEWSATGKNTLSAVDDTRRFLWAGAEPNFYASTLIFPFFAAIAFALTAPTNFKKSCWWTIVLLCAFGILGTYSRSAFLVTAAFFAIFLIRFRKQAIWCGALLAIAYITMATLVPSVPARLLSIGENVVSSGGTGRKDTMLAGVFLYPEAPLGAGLGASQELFSAVGTVGSSHNTYLQVLIETGPQGLCVIIAILLVGIKSMARSRRISASSGHLNDNLLFTSLLFGIAATAFFAATIPVGDMKFLFLLSVFGYIMPGFYRRRLSLKAH